DEMLRSPIRSYRLRPAGDPAPATVYNFEVDARDELDKNFIVFSSRLTPVLVSNSHAAVVARRMGKPCVVGAGEITGDYRKSGFTARGRAVEAGDTIAIDGSTGEVILGAVPLVPAKLDDDFREVMEWVDAARKLRVRTNADTEIDARTARSFGA